MSKFNVEELSLKYFDSVYYTYQFSSKDFEQFLYPIIKEAVAKLEISDHRREDFLNELTEERSAIIENLSKELNSIRKIKRFKLVFTRNLNKVHDDIYLPDVVIISIIEATRWELFDFIRKNQKQLSIDEQLIESSLSIFFPGDFSNLQNGYNQILRRSNLSEEDKTILFLLFPHIKKAVAFDPKINYDAMESFGKMIFTVMEEMFHKRRMAYYTLMSKLFAFGKIEESIERLTSQKYKNQLLDSLAGDEFNLKYSIKLLKALFPDGNYYRRIRITALKWVSYVVEKNANRKLCRNLLISLSFVAKSFSDERVGFFELGEKKQASFLTLRYIENHKSDEQILIEILKPLDNSDVFADTILFYTINPGRRNFELTKETENNVIIAYLDRIESKIDNTTSIFEPSYFDDINVTIWRWYQAINACLDRNLQREFKYEIKKKIFEDSMKNPTNFEVLAEFSFQDDGDEDIFFIPKEFMEITGEENFIKLAKAYLKNQRFIKFDERKIKAVTEWYSKTKN